MSLLELNIVGDMPDDLDISPVTRVIRVLNQTELDWILPGVINLKLVDDKAIQALNKTYSGNDYATDVLSFSYIEGRGHPSTGLGPNGRTEDRGQSWGRSTAEPEELGDMVVSIETAQRQAKLAHTSLADEVATLTLHGLLHIFGFDHADEQGQQAMNHYQEDILAQAKVDYRDFKWQ